MRRLGAVLVLVALVAWSPACGESGGTRRGATAGSVKVLDVTSDVLRDESTQDVLVFAPKASGRWPVVVAFHGINGTASDMAELATRLAQDGFVVFAPTYRSEILTQEGREQAAYDGECGYRFARGVAGRYGGDLTQPVTFVGWSLGASLALALGLTEEIDPSGEVVSCFSPVPRPDLVVAVSGCHYENEGRKTGYLDHSGWTNKDAGVVLIGGGRDTTCAGWQSEDAAAELRSAGFDVELTMIDDATHFAPIFHEDAGGEMVVDRAAEAGETTLEVITDAVATRRARG